MGVLPAVGLILAGSLGLLAIIGELATRRRRK